MLKNNYEPFSLDGINLTKYMFFTGKGGVGKTSTACAVAVNLADNGKSVLLISTDPASNLQDVFNTELDGKGVPIDGVPGLVVANLDPEEAAREYRESVIAPYRGKLPASVIVNMEEQLSGSCTVEIAAFDQFSNFITDKSTENKYDYIIFDTAPTGHTLRMLQLPSAWSNFISESTHGASCLGQLAGLQDKKDMYKNAVENLADKDKTTLILVSRPEETPLIEAERSSHELSELGINNQVLIINGILSEATDDVSIKMLDKQQKALENMPQGLKKFKIFTIPLRSYNVVGIDNIRTFLYSDEYTKNSIYSKSLNLRHLDVLIEDIYRAGKKVIFTMGKGGVGKTTIAATIAVALARKGVKAHLTSTDPADHLKYVVEDTENIKLSKIDEKKELLRYQNEVLSKARETMSEDDIAYVEEDLRSPCTQEIAVFRAFAEIVDKAENEVVIIDTAPTGHTLLLLDSTQSYHREVQRTKGETPVSVQRLLPRLRDEKQTEVIIVTLPEATPVFEAQRLSDDLNRAGINNKWWVVNQCLSLTNTKNSMLIARADAEKQWLEKVKEISSDNFVGIPWFQDASIESIVNCSGGSKSDE
ncbi:arsenical pump-driving ATPase [Heyndrickxia coagulans]|uniref:Arsenite efflux ATP-binding protein ArsA (TC 3.A.4.1.1) n=5 Tax=Heyndrickxia coagulans TaxID=1398 RepID=A0A8B4BVW5_HEYCO|nr:arsenical pump-driving ATPase [Heyndrickxia coagulans]AJH78007.1 arsenical pump-driving ATPase [Heyndrickxia coagulans DSM 1 = ATCC 7050]MCR2847161.1 arsenical pump-driving ATPase [Heyndrickxia coagulans]MED4495122.1 arsenical pump-driving ATPase [Heyndrickxia coagulans]MED4535882.1 arsenical pump-driving ATPase [Heyndrickxia coagulans]QJE31449.1 arsenical pump-driving ATPase [Heyndrickxia coagulans]